MASIVNKRYYCEHCDDYVSRSTYRWHQKETERKRIKTDDDYIDEASDKVYQ